MRFDCLRGFSGGSRRHRLALALGGLCLLPHPVAAGQTVFDGGGWVTVPGSRVSPWYPDTLIIGKTSTGFLWIGTGGMPGTVIATGAFLGSQPGADGVVEIAGQGSLWTLGDNVLQVGVGGKGTVTATAGAAMVSGAASLGELATGQGLVTLDTGATWQVGELTVGRAGQGELVVAGGSRVEASQQVLLGALQGSAGILAVRDGGALETTAGLTVGDSGAGTLALRDGGTVGSLFGRAAASPLGSAAVTVEGPGSRWDMAGDLDLGGWGSASLTIAGGGVVSDASGLIAAQASTGSSTATVVGADSAWINAADLQVGTVGSGRLTVADGGRVTAGGNAIVGYYPGSTALVTVTGTGSRLEVGGALLLGGDLVYAATGDLVVGDGGTVAVGQGAGTITVAAGGDTISRLVIGADPTQAAPNDSGASLPGTLEAAEVFLGAGAGELIFNHGSDGYLFAPLLAGAGRVEQRAGTTVLTADSVGFAGSTEVLGGRLLVEGRLGGTVSVRQGGTLGGGGTVADLAFDAGAFYQVSVDADGQAVGLRASGTAALDGTVRVLAAGGDYAPATQYTILTADGGISGGFSGGASSNLAFLDPALSYDANSVFLTLTRNDTGFANVGITANQIATGGGVESLGAGNAVYDEVLALSEDQARTAFDQLSGELHASLQGLMIGDAGLLRTALLDRQRAATDGEGLVLWGTGLGGWGHGDGDGNAARIDAWGGGFLIGADVAVAGGWRLGAAAGYSHDGFNVDAPDSSGSSDNYHLALYGSGGWGALALRAGAAYSWHDVETQRTAAFPGFAETLDAGYRAGTAQAYGEIGYGLGVGPARLEPFGTLAYVDLGTDGFTESGGAAALSVDGENSDATFTTLGLRASTGFTLGGLPATASGLAGWQHAFGDTTPAATMTFAAGGDSFTVEGVPLARDAALVQAGIGVALRPNAALGLTYGGQFGSGVTAQSLLGTLTLAF